MVSIDKPSGGRTLAGWAILALPLIVMFFLFVTPVIRLAALSLTDLNASNFSRGGEFVGFKHYSALFGDPELGRTILNTFLSPQLILRLLLCAALPFSLAVLLMELRSGARIALQAVLAPVIFFSGAALTAIFFTSYYAPSGLLNNFLTSSGFQRQPTLEYAIGRGGGLFGNILNLLLANGLALTLPLGLALFLAVARGARATALDASRMNRELFPLLGRAAAGFLFLVAGFSLVSLEGMFAINNPLMDRPDLLSFSIRWGMMMLGFSFGSAAALLLIPPLLVIGLGVVLFLERRNAPVSLRFFPKAKGRLIEAKGALGGKIALLIGAGNGTLILLVVLATVFFLPWLGGALAALGVGDPMAAVIARDGGAVFELPPEFFPALFISLAAALASALLCHALTAAVGFSLGYLRPRGGKAVIVFIGLCLFLSPAILTIPYYFGFRELGLLNTFPSLILPYLVSPLGALLFTWYFRGARDEREWLTAQGIPLGRGAFPKRLAGGFLRLSLPVFAFYFLSSLNMLLIPYIMVSANPDVSPLSYQLYRLSASVIRGSVDSFSTEGEGFLVTPKVIRAATAHFSMLQYVIPLALLIISVIVVFPRLALIIRRKGEAAPALDPADVEKLKG